MTNQTRIHLIHTNEARTWKTNGSKHRNVLGVEDKRQITIAVSSLATKIVLSF